MSSPEILTFGCRLNAYESEVMRGHGEHLDLSDTVIVNTCAVTAEAERQARQAIRKARRRRPEARIIVTGCAAQISPERFAEMPEVDRVIGNQEKLDFFQFGRRETTRVAVDDIMAVRETAHHLIAGFDQRTRAFVAVQNGCDHRCTFCIIPYGRGNSRSVPLGAIADQVRLVVANGTREVVLSGVDITSYGADLPGRPSLGQAVRRLLAAVPGLERLRLSSIDVAEIDDTLLGLIGDEPRLMPHLHLSLQAGDDMILKRMKRRHRRDQALRFCETVRGLRPGIALGADLIAGFPTETDANFANTLAMVEAADLAHLHVFPYSPREGTPAARMPQVAPAVRKARAAALRAAGEAALARHLKSRVGRTEAVLMETGATGRTETFASARLASDQVPGSIVAARVTGIDGAHLVAEAA